MKLNRIFDILLGVSFGGVLSFYLYTHYFIPPKQPKNKFRIEIIKSNDILKQRTVLSSNIINTALTSGTCTLFLKDIAEIPMIEFANQFIDHTLDNTLKTCSGALPSTLEEKLKTATSSCQNSTREKFTRDCFRSLVDVKTESVFAIIKHDAEPRELDASILVHLLAHKISSEEPLSSPEKTLQMIDYLIEKEPNYLTGYKIKLFILSKSSLTQSAHNKLVFEDTLVDAKMLGRNDSDLTKDNFGIGNKLELDDL